MSIVYEKFDGKYECVGKEKDGISILSVFVKDCDKEAKISVADRNFPLADGRCNITLRDACDGEYALLLYDRDIAYELGVIRKVGKIITLPYESAEMAEMRKRTNLGAKERDALARRIEMLEKCVFKTTIL